MLERKKTKLHSGQMHANKRLCVCMVSSLLAMSTKLTKTIMPSKHKNCKQVEDSMILSPIYYSLSMKWLGGV